MQFPLEVHENLNKVLLQFTELSRRRLLKTGNDQDNKRITGLSAHAEKREISNKQFQRVSRTIWIGKTKM